MKTSRICLALAASLGLAGCDALFDVDNPNNVTEEDFRDPASQDAIASGILYEVQDAWAWSILPYAVATDEAIGMDLEGGAFLNEGNVSIPSVQLTELAFSNVAEARWLVNEGIGLLEGFNRDPEIAFDRRSLANAYLYGAVLYTSIADRWDDFVISSNKQEAGPAVGENNMRSLYEIAIEYLTAGLAIAEAEGSAELVTQFRALRASAAHREAIWDVVQPSFRLTPPVYVAVSAQALEDAHEAVAISGEDWAWYFNYRFATIPSVIGLRMNVFRHFQVDERFAVHDAQLGLIATALSDPIDGVPAPELDEILFQELTCCGEESPLRVTSGHEMLLILAEHAVATSGNNRDDASAVGFVNRLRALNGLTPFDPVVHARLTAGELIQHHRSASLFMQGRRLSDMYRFGISDSRWLPGSDAITRPGTFLPIPQIECHANPHVDC